MRLTLSIYFLSLFFLAEANGSRSCVESLIRTKTSIENTDWELFKTGHENTLVISDMPLFNESEIALLLKNAHDKHKQSGALNPFGSSMLDIVLGSKESEVVLGEMQIKINRYIEHITKILNKNIANERGLLTLERGHLRFDGTAAWMHKHNGGNAYVTVLKTEMGQGTVYMDSAEAKSIAPNIATIIMTDHQREKLMAPIIEGIRAPEHGPPPGQRIVLILGFKLKDH